MFLYINTYNLWIINTLCVKLKIMNASLLALFACISFALGSQFFTHYSRKFSALWMNVAKASIASFLFALIVLGTSGFHYIETSNFLFFFISGFIGLGIGDIFMMQSFKEIGPGRTMLLFGFNPIIVGVLAYFFLDQSIVLSKLIGIFFFIICIIIFSVENFKISKSWGLKGLSFAFIGMALDAVGILITRHAFDLNSELTSFEGNFYRCVGAISSYVIIRFFVNFDFLKHFKESSYKSRFYIVLGATLGTVISLALYLKAIQTAENLASVTAISITSVLFASLFECIWTKKMPSKYLLMALVLFFIGMYFVI